MRFLAGTLGRMFWSVCAMCVLLPVMAAAGSSSNASDESGRACFIPQLHQPSLLHSRRSSNRLDRRHHLPRDLRATAADRADSAEDESDSESVKRASSRPVPAVLHRFCPAPVQNISAREGAGTSRIFPLVSRLAPRPPPASFPL